MPSLICGGEGVGHGEARGVLGHDPIGRYSSTLDGAELAVGRRVAAEHAALWLGQSTRGAQHRGRRHPLSTRPVAPTSRSWAAAIGFGCGLSAAAERRRAGLSDKPSVSSSSGSPPRPISSSPWPSCGPLDDSGPGWRASLGVPRHGGQRQHAITSRAMLTRYDPWVNLLRNTVACFAAGVGWSRRHHRRTPRPARRGGRARASSASAWPGTPRPSWRRSPTSAQVIDPAGGSWYVEWLTDARGPAGMVAVPDHRGGGWHGGGARQPPGPGPDCRHRGGPVSSGLARRQDAITGVSDFPNVRTRFRRTCRTAGPEGGAAAAPLRRSPIEALRQRTDELRAPTRGAAGGPARPAWARPRTTPPGPPTPRTSSRRRACAPWPRRCGGHRRGLVRESSLRARGPPELPVFDGCHLSRPGRPPCSMCSRIPMSSAGTWPVARDTRLPHWNWPVPTSSSTPAATSSSHWAKRSR